MYMYLNDQYNTKALKYFSEMFVKSSKVLYLFDINSCRVQFTNICGLIVTQWTVSVQRVRFDP